MRTLLASLSEQPLALLRGIAELRGVALASNVRDEAAAQLAAALDEASATVAAVEATSAAAQETWAELRRNGGKMKLAAFARQAGEIRPVGPGRLEREALWRQPENVAEELWYRGLIFRTFADFGDGPVEYVYIPEDLPLPPLQAARPRPAAGALLQAVDPPQRAWHALNSLAVDVCTVLAELRENPLPVEKGEPDAARAEELRGRLLLPDATRFRLLSAICTDAGFWAFDRERRVVDNQRAGGWLRLTHWEQMSLLFSTWRDSITWNDLRCTPGLVTEGGWTNDAPLARRRLLQVLKRLESRTWYSVDEFVALIKQTDPDFQRPDGSYTGWYVRDAETGQYLSGFDSWEAVEGRLLRFLIAGPLFWLGAVAVGGAGGDGATANAERFRLTPAGAAWLASRMPKEPPQPAKLVVGDDFTVTAPLLTPLLDRYRLARFTDPLPCERWEQRRETRVPAPTQHRISRASLSRARAAGLKAVDAAAFLRRAAVSSRATVRIANAVERYDQLGGEVRLTQGAVLQVKDAAALAALRADPLVAPLLGELISAQAVIVPLANVDRLVRILHDSGYSVDLR